MSRVRRWRRNAPRTAKVEARQLCDRMCHVVSQAFADDSLSDSASDEACTDAAYAHLPSLISSPSLDDQPVEPDELLRIEAELPQPASLTKSKPLPAPKLSAAQPAEEQPLPSPQSWLSGRWSALNTRSGCCC